MILGPFKILDGYSNVHRAPGTVFTNGCFDILHVGHVRLLQRAAMFGKRLVVAVNSDRSVKILKGPKRPVRKLLERMEMLAGLLCVDIVTSFDETDAAAVIHHIQPHCWIKGGDYTMQSLNGDEIKSARDCGCAIVILEKFGDYSTTGILEKLKG